MMMMKKKKKKMKTPYHRCCCSHLLLLLSRVFTCCCQKKTHLGGRPCKLGSLGTTTRWLPSRLRSPNWSPFPDFLAGRLLDLFRIQLGQPATVKVAANLIRLLSYQNKNMLQTGMIVGGWDKYEGGQIYSVPLGGTILRQPFTIGGSGSSYLYGFFDQAWKEGMNKDEAEKLVVKAVSLAIARDGASGGVVRTVIINSDGVTRNFYSGDSLPLWHEELEAYNSLLDIPEPMVQ